MTAHAELGASSAHRWMRCPAAPRLSRGLSSGSEYADEGTLAHNVASSVLLQDEDPFWGAKFDEYQADERVTREMWSAVEDYVEYVERVRGRDGIVQSFVEEKVRFDEYVPDGFGTVDFGALSDGTAWVVDLKYGKGVRVDAEWNPQPMLYALGFLQEFGWLADISTVKIAIIQPRLDHVSEWEISVDDLFAWANGELADAVARVTEDAPAVPGEKQCQFCPAKGSCKALTQHITEVAAQGFCDLTTESPIKTAPPDRLSDVVLADILEDLPLIRAWLPAVEDEALKRLMRGAAVPGWKAVQGVKNRQWTDETAAEKALGRAGLKMADRFSKRLISPSQAEKKIGKDHKLLDKYVHRPPAGPTLVREKDPRPALVTDVAAGFDDLTQIENTETE